MNNFSQTLIDYFRGSYQELKRVIWPSQNTTIRLTLLVIGVSVLVSLILGIFDALFTSLLNLLLSYA